MKKIFAFLIASFLIIPTAGAAQYNNDGKTGSIADLSYYPDKPAVSKPVTLSFALKNIGEVRQTFKVKLFLIKDGNIIQQDDSFLSVYPGEKKGNSSEFVPKSAGSYEILAKLYDKYETKLLDMASAKMDVASELGPFDLIITPLARKVAKGDELPVLLTVINKGISGTDVSIRINVKCSSRNISDSFTIFSSPDRRIDKMMTFPVCEENGAHNIESAITADGKVYAMSAAQFYINDTIFTMDLKIPQELSLEQGGTRLFDISVRNAAPYELHKVKLLSEGFPADWITIEPDAVPLIRQNESAIFLASIRIPKDAEARAYALKFIAYSDELSNRESSVLKVLEANIAPLPASEGRNLADYYNYIIFAAAAAGLLAIIRFGKKEERRNPLACLKCRG